MLLKSDRGLHVSNYVPQRENKLIQGKLKRGFLEGWVKDLYIYINNTLSAFGKQLYNDFMHYAEQRVQLTQNDRE